MMSYRRLLQTLMGRREQLRGRSQAGMTTAEYAVGRLF